MDRRSHQGAKADADHQREHQADNRIHVQIGHTIRDQHTCQGRHSSDGKIDSSRNQNHGHTDSTDPVVGIFRKHTDNQCPEGKEALIRVVDRTEQIDNQKDPDGRVNHDVFRIHDAGEKALTLFCGFFHDHLPPFSAFLQAGTFL